MAEQLVGLIFDGGKKLVTALKKVKTTKKDAYKLEQYIVLVESVCTDVIPRHEDGRKIERNPNMMLRMRLLKDALEEAEREVDRYVKRGILYQLYKVDEMTKKLASLRQDINELMTISWGKKIDEIYEDGKDSKHMLTYLVQSLNQMQPDKDTPVAVAMQQRVWTQIQLCTRQREDTESVSGALFIPFGLAAVLLRHLNWDSERVKNEWRQHGDKLRKAVGLPSSRSCLGWRPNSDDTREHSSCNICFGAGGFDAVAAGTTMISAGCSHYFCNECWRRYISAAVREGSLQCLSLRCPDPSCQMPVIQELVDMVKLNKNDGKLYAMFARCSYVDNSGGRMKWCPRGCGGAIELVGGAGASTSANNDVMAVACCKCSFCWSCGEEPHRPVSCDTACTWLDTITPREDEVLMFIKRCPKCRKLIENFQRTNNVMCSAPCGHRFCWICLHPLAGSNHRTATCTRYRYMTEIILQVSGTDLQGAGFERERQAMLTTKKEEHHKAVASSHYKQWVANQASLKVALEEMDAQKSVVSNMADSLGVDLADLNFFSQAYEEMSECRRVILWSYPYCYYYLDPKRDDGDKWQLLELLVKEANDSLKSLRDLVTEENMLSLYNYDQDVREACEAFKTQVMDSTAKMRDKVEKLVKAVETQFECFA